MVFDDDVTFNVGTRMNCGNHHVTSPGCIIIEVANSATREQVGGAEHPEAMSRGASDKGLFDSSHSTAKSPVGKPEHHRHVYRFT